MPRPRASHAILLAAFLLGCSGGGGSQGAGGPPVRQGGLDPVRRDVAEVIGTVSGAPLSADDFKMEASRRPVEGGGDPTDADRKAVVDELVTQEVLFQEALEKGLYHDTKVRKILVNLLLRQEVYASVDNEDFTDAELEKYYADHNDEFIVPEKVQIKRILLRVSPERDDAATKALADQLFAEVSKDPRVFGEVAARRSEGPYQRRGGDLGFIPVTGKPGVEPEVVAAAFEMKVDEIHPPMKVGDAWHILYLTNRRDRVERSFQQMKGSVLRMVKQERFKTLTDAYIEKARAKHEISIDEAKIAAIDLSRGGGRPPLSALGPPGGDDEEGQEDEQ